MNWNDRLTKAEERGSFTAEDKKLAGDFRSCAVGEKFDLKSRFSPKERIPVLANYGERAFWLGISFVGAVKDNKVAEARRIYDEVQNL